MSLVVRSEKEEGVSLLETKIYKNDIYQVQQGSCRINIETRLFLFCISTTDTLIVWTDPETDTDLALSFQEAAGCKEIWYT